MVDEVGTAAPRAGRREWIGLAVIALPCLLYSMDLTVLFLAVPQLSEDLDPSSAELLWISDIYGFLLAGLLITMGTLGDRVGRRRLLLIGAAAFGAASVLAAFSTSAEMLIAARAILGIAAATLAPSTLSLIRNMFHDDRQRTVAIAVWVTSFSAGAAIGPLAGGLLLERFWWGSVFLLAVPVMALLLLLGPRLLPEYRDPGAGRLDLVSAAMSLLAVLGVVYGVKRIAEDGSAGVASIVSIAAGLAVGALFLARQRRLEDPLLDLRLFRAPAFSAALGVNSAALFVVFGSEFFIAQYLQLVLGYSPLEAGLWTLPSAFGFIAGSLLSPALVRRVAPRVAVAGAAGLAVAGLALMTRVDGESGLAAVVAGSVLLALGASPAVTLGTDLVVGAAPPERAGVASGLSETGAELGGALGIAVLGSIGAAVYRGRMEDAAAPGVDPGAAEAARDTLGGAVGAAADLPARLLDAAADAFAAGFQAAAIAGAALMAAVAVLAAFLLRAGTETSDDRQEDPCSETRVPSPASPCPTPMRPGTSTEGSSGSR
ncbi:MAG TPA: MFS transporter [Miltoncostaeaceae bacterium]|nr:MFS transporter [Miltoncostaeaceae bacterium]